jgi:hypothetical protein
LEFSNVAEGDESFGNDAFGVAGKRRLGIFGDRAAAESGRFDFSEKNRNLLSEIVDLKQVSLDI